MADITVGAVNQTSRFNKGGVEFYDLTFTVAAEASDNIDVSLQLVGRNTTDKVAKKITLLAYYTADAAAAGTLAGGSGITTFSVNGAVVAGELMKTITASQFLVVSTDAAGLLTIRMNIATASTRYLNIIMPDGRVVQSPLLTWV